MGVGALGCAHWFTPRVNTGFHTLRGISVHTLRGTSGQGAQCVVCTLEPLGCASLDGRGALLPLLRGTVWHGTSWATPLGRAGRAGQAGHGHCHRLAGTAAHPQCTLLPLRCTSYGSVCSRACVGAPYGRVRCVPTSGRPRPCPPRPGPAGPRALAHLPAHPLTHPMAPTLAPTPAHALAPTQLAPLGARRPGALPGACPRGGRPSGGRGRAEGACLPAGR